LCAVLAGLADAVVRDRVELDHRPAVEPADVGEAELDRRAPEGIFHADPPFAFSDYMLCLGDCPVLTAELYEVLERKH
jgi:hypothetical protein